MPFGLLVAACCGAMLAVGEAPTPQVPVETGQVLAGIVSYPPDNPFYVYHLKLWSLLNQGAALLLRAGIPDLHASLLIEGALAAISFAAIFLTVFALCGRTAVALLAPLFIYHFDLVGIPIAYPILLLGTSHSYGILGLSSSLLVIACFGAGRYRTGALLCGIIPCIHPSLGAFTWGILAVSIIVNLKPMRPLLPKLLPFFGAGTVITAASLLGQLQFVSRASGLDPGRKEEYMEAFISNFDLHRNFSGWGLSWGEGGLLIGVLVALVAILTLWRQSPPLGPRLLLTAVASSVVITVTAAALAEFVPLFRFLKILMPWRYMNFANLCTMPVAIGLLAGDFCRMPRLRSALLLAVLLAGGLWGLLSPLEMQYLYEGVLVSLFFVLAFTWPDPSAMPFALSLRFQEWVTAGLIALFLSLRVMPAGLTMVRGFDAQTPAIYQFISTRPGVLLTAGNFHLIQLMTRRPVLMDGGGLDFFSYVPEAGPRFNAILRLVYGLDLFVPPGGEQQNRGELTFEHQSLWEDRSPEEWRAIRDEFGVTDILTPADWNLKLPAVAGDGDLKLSTIP